MLFTGSAHAAEDDFDAVKKAAELGDVDAQVRLGVMYDYGEGVSEDDAEAVRWYRKAAEQGDAGAQHNLGVMYARWRWRDPGLCRGRAQWFRKSAEQGHAAAQFLLGTHVRQWQRRARG